MARAKLPKHLLDEYGSTRQFKSDKRAALRVMERALGEYRWGCAYLSPEITRAVQRVHDEVEELKRLTSQEVIGR